MPRNSNSLKRAYSLAEMAIVLGILGVLAGTFFDVKKFTTDTTNIKNINVQMIQIEEAIDTYVAKTAFYLALQKEQMPQTPQTLV
jgi:type II secretory pathway pseudopilin PulG